MQLQSLPLKPCYVLSGDIRQCHARVMQSRAQLAVTHCSPKQWTRCRATRSSCVTRDAGAISACVAPLFSQRPDIHQWLHHYTQLGVNKFYMYVPRLHYHEPHLYHSPHEVRP